jgi:anthranilate/para-aminobenzoate synthase component II
MASEQVSQLYDTILILDFGSQYTHLIARRIRELGVYCELYACNIDITTLKFKPKGIILSGGPYSVYDKEAPHVDPRIWDFQVPVLGICYGLQVSSIHPVGSHGFHGMQISYMETGTGLEPRRTSRPFRQARVWQSNNFDCF